MKVQKLFDYTEPFVAAATILGCAVIISVGIAAYTAQNIKRAQDVIVVTGSAKTSVVADTARWIINLDTKTGTTNQQAGFNRLEEATKKAVAYLESQGLTEYETPAMNVYTNYSYPQYAEPIFTGYTVSRQIIVRSSDVEKISMLANSIEPFTGPNYNVTTGSLELTYSKLDELRVTLLSEAIKDATARADAIAKETDRSIGVLRSASSGVVQVLPQDGIDISDYGTYDTQSMGKDVMVTVRATFEL